MTRQFILDENIVILAQRKADPQGNYDATCLNLIDGIIEICHAVIIDSYLWNRYQQQLGRISTAGLGPPNLFHTLQGARQRSGKLQFLPDAPTFPEEPAVPQGSQDDVPIVRLAISTGAILVTTDSPLISDLETAGITQQYQLQVVTPDQALNLL